MLTVMGTTFTVFHALLVKFPLPLKVASNPSFGNNIFGFLLLRFLVSVGMEGEVASLDFVVAKGLGIEEMIVSSENTLLTDITRGNITGMADGSGDESEDFDIEEYSEEIRPTKSSHIIFGKSTIGNGHIEVLKNRRCISDVGLVRLGGEETMPKPHDNDVVIF